MKVTLVGRLDTPGVDGIEARFLDALAASGHDAIVDLSQVEFVASMGIRMIVAAARSLRARQAALAVYGAQERVSQVFGLVSLGKILPICATEAEAIAAVRATSA